MRKLPCGRVEFVEGLIGPGALSSKTIEQFPCCRGQRWVFHDPPYYARGLTAVNAVYRKLKSSRLSPGPRRQCLNAGASSGFGVRPYMPERAGEQQAYSIDPDSAGCDERQPETTMDITPPCPGCGFAWNGVYRDNVYHSERTLRSHRVCAVCGYSTDDPTRDQGQWLADVLRSDEWQNAKKSGEQVDQTPDGETREFELFVPYHLDVPKLLRSQFAFIVRPFPPPEEHDSGGTRMLLSGDDLGALIASVPRDVEDEGDDDTVESNDYIILGEHKYEACPEVDRGALALLLALWTGLRSSDRRKREIALLVAAGRALFYLLNRERDPTTSGYRHMYTLLALVQGDDGKPQSRVFTFCYHRWEVSPIERFFRGGLDTTAEAAFTRARIAHDLRSFFTNDEEGVFWRAVFVQRARNDAEVSRVMAQCIPDLTGLAKEHHAHILRRDPGEIQSARANRMADRLQHSIERLVWRVEWVLLLAGAAVALLIVLLWKLPPH